MCLQHTGKTDHTAEQSRDYRRSHKSQQNQQKHNEAWDGRENAQSIIVILCYTHCVFIEPQHLEQFRLCLSSWLEEMWCNKGKKKNNAGGNIKKERA